ncbi:hypothetical protein, partial [Brevibacillus parabrevis]|uniref:hypothetical protein n=1 Tax=Brevibacillus parabrevis TaxID=54914 RepID=UPI002E2386E0|nr:hypothetical protein [Brevibacillus parabrevis]
VCVVGTLGAARKETNRCSFVGYPLGAGLHGSGEKAKPRQKQLAHRCRFTLTLKTVFRFFLGTSVGIPKSFRGFVSFLGSGWLWSARVSKKMPMSKSLFELTLCSLHHRYFKRW